MIRLPLISLQNLEKYIAARDAALLSFDRKQIEPYLAQKTGKDAPTDKEFWTDICEEILKIKNLNKYKKARAEEMLENLKIHDNEYAKRFN